MSIKLYQFAVSHYSEKVRWALDHKRIPYESVWLLPGTHVKTIRNLTGQKTTSVPVLTHDDVVIQGSSAIIDYLDSSFADAPLTPDNANDKASALAWEQRLDEEAGPAVRTFAYHHLLQRPALMVPLMTRNTPFWNRYFFLLAFSRVEKQVRRLMRINEETAAQARGVAEKLLAELAEAYQQRPYLVGNRLTRADIAAGALFGMLTMPEQYPVSWPGTDRLPSELRTWVTAHQNQLAPLADLYQRHR